MVEPRTAAFEQQRHRLVAPPPELHQPFPRKLLPPRDRLDGEPRLRPVELAAPFAHQRPQRRLRSLQVARSALFRLADPPRQHAGVSRTAVSRARLRSVETVSARPSRLVASSKRRLGSASNWSGEGSARAAALSAVRLRSKLRDVQAFSRAARLASVASSSAFTGTANSAAPVGVGARTSAT